jgi:TolB protein
MMKTLKLQTFAPLFACFLLFTACTPASLTEMPTSEALPATETPVPTQEPTPTVTSLPLPCTIAFDSDRDGNREIYVMDPDGSNLVNLSNDPADDFAPAWSPDGSRIAFVSTRPNEQGSVQAIYVMNADGSNLYQLTTNIYSDWPDWSHDGSRITYTGNEDIHVINADGSGQPVNLTNSPERDNWPAWSPDDNQIVWSAGSDGNWNNFVMNADGSNVLKITDNGQVAAAQWTRDGRIFTGWGWAGQEPFCQNCLVDADGSNIADAGGKAELQRYFPFWTLEGERVEVALGGDEIQLVGEIYPGLFLNLTNNPAQDLNPDWPARCGQ